MRIKPILLRLERGLENFWREMSEFQVAQFSGSSFVTEENKFLKKEVEKKIAKIVVTKNASTQSDACLSCQEKTEKIHIFAHATKNFEQSLAQNKKIKGIGKLKYVRFFCAKPLTNFPPDATPHICRF